jgi:uroporphyrinogen-III synthase
VSGATQHGPLSGRSIAVTRPEQQAQRLCAAIEAAGGEAVRHPLIEIGAPVDLRGLQQVLARAARYDWAIFSSPTAVERGLAALAAVAPVPPARWRVAAIGEGTVRALARHGVTGVLAPTERYDSEALLECPGLGDLRGQAVLVFRGQEGRDALERGLRQRGAAVEFAACYTRRRPEGTAAILAQRAREGRLDAVVVTSSEAAGHLAAMLEGIEAVALRALPVFAPHPRIVAALREVGFANARLTAGGDDGVVEALVAWAREPGGDTA